MTETNTQNVKTFSISSAELVKVVQGHRAVLNMKQGYESVGECTLVRTSPGLSTLHHRWGKYSCASTSSANSSEQEPPHPSCALSTGAPLRAPSPAASLHGEGPALITIEHRKYRTLVPHSLHARNMQHPPHPNRSDHDCEWHQPPCTHSLQPPVLWEKI